jgi:hypothetical protein
LSDGIAGTLVRDVIEYDVGFGPLGALANLLFVARQMRSTFAARQESLPKLLALSQRLQTEGDPPA